MSRNILAVVAHADDEVLGCGGTLKRHSIEGDNVYICILSDGESSRLEKTIPNEELISLREQTAREASNVLGATEVFLHRLPDNRLDTIARLDIVILIENHIQKYFPEIIYTHHSGDLNIDHRRVHEGVITACRPQPNHPVNTILCFETLSSTEWQPPSSNFPFLPNWYVDISKTLEHKIKAMEIYSNEMKSFPHARSIEAATALARWRGASVGMAAAEAFILARKIL